MTQRQTFARRATFFWTCIASATILDDSEIQQEEEGQEKPCSLRQEASCNGLCYVRVLRQVNQTDLYFAEVAATPDRLQTHPLTIFLTEEQLYYTLPYDIRLMQFQETLKDKAPARIIDLLRKHAATVRPLEQKEPASEAHAQTAPSVPLIPLEGETIEVPAEAIQDALAPASPARSHRTPSGTFVSVSRLQQTLLNAAIDHLMGKLYQGKERAQALVLHTQCALLARLQRWQRRTHQQVVNAIPVFNKQHHQVMWRLSVGIPVGFAV